LIVTCVYTSEGGSTRRGVGRGHRGAVNVYREDFDVFRAIISYENGNQGNRFRSVGEYGIEVYVVDCEAFLSSGSLLLKVRPLAGAVCAIAQVGPSYQTRPYGQREGDHYQSPQHRANRQAGSSCRLNCYDLHTKIRKERKVMRSRSIICFKPAPNLPSLIFPAINPPITA